MNIIESKETNTGEPVCTFEVKITPGSSQNKILGLYQNAIKIAIQAPPEKGAANRMLIQFLAKQLQIPKKNIQIISGETQPLKRIQITAISKTNLISFFS